MEELAVTNVSTPEKEKLAYIKVSSSNFFLISVTVSGILSTEKNNLHFFFKLIRNNFYIIF